MSLPFLNTNKHTRCVLLRAETFTSVELTYHVKYAENTANAVYTKIVVKVNEQYCMIERPDIVKDFYETK